MSKINATYSSGYYLAPDADYRKLEDERTLERRKRRREGKDGDSAADKSSDADVKRQTFAIPFDLICLSCQRRIARGSHVYANRRATPEKYLGRIRIWELEVRCRYCQANYYLRTDPATPKETGGYVCARLCCRVEGDFYSINKMNEEGKAAQEKMDEAAALDPLQVLERENEATRRLAERNREIEEDVEARADADDTALLHALRATRTRTVGMATGTPCQAELTEDGPQPRIRGDEAEADDDDDGVQASVLARWQREVARRGQRKAQQQQEQPQAVIPTMAGGTGPCPVESPNHSTSASLRAMLAVPCATSAPPRNAFLLADDEDRHDDAQKSGGGRKGRVAISGQRDQGTKAMTSLPPPTVNSSLASKPYTTVASPALRRSVLQSLVESDDDQ